VVTAVGLLSVGLAFYPMPWGEGFSADLGWGLLGVGAGLLVLRAGRARPESPDPVSFEPVLIGRV
jgi:hypothetical protein